MGILSSLKSAWRSASTAERINLVLDIVCGIGMGAVSGKLLTSVTPNMNRIEKVCTSVAMTGLGMAAGEIAANAWHPYTEAVGKIVDKVSEKKESEKKEEA